MLVIEEIQWASSLISANNIHQQIDPLIVWPIVPDGEITTTSVYDVRKRRAIPFLNIHNRIA